MLIVKKILPCLFYAFNFLCLVLCHVGREMNSQLNIALHCERCAVVWCLAVTH